MNALNPTDYNHPARKTLSETDTAALAEAVLTLTQELWILADRQMVMEAVLARHGIDISDEIDRFEPDEALQAKMNEKCQFISRRIVNAMAGLSSDG